MHRLSLCKTTLSYVSENGMACSIMTTITLLISESSLKGHVLQQSMLLLELDDVGQPITVLIRCLHEDFVQSLVFQLP